MEIEKSRNGYYTLTFLNKNNLDESEIHREFSSVGNVCRIIQNSQRIFIRFRQRDEAERAIKRFGKVYEVEMAKNRLSDNLQPDGGFNHNPKLPNNHIPSLGSSETSSLSQSNEKLNSNKVFHLILGNLPDNYTIKDVRALVEEAKPVYIYQLEETRVFNIRFCQVVLNSSENLKYLIDKLNGFMISGKELIAAEAKNLVEWREKAITGKVFEEPKPNPECSGGKRKKKVPKSGKQNPTGSRVLGALPEVPKTQGGILFVGNTSAQRLDNFLRKKKMYGTWLSEVQKDPEELGLKEET